MQTKENIPHISRILPFENRLRIFDAPKIRFIGKAIRDTLWSDPCPCPGFWSDFYAKGDHLAIDALPHVLPGMMAWSGEYTPETKQYTYMICAACPEGTPVPEGYAYRDVPLSLIAHGKTGEAMEARDAELAVLGFFRHDDGWCGEFYPDPDAEGIQFCWVFPVRRCDN